MIDTSNNKDQLFSGIFLSLILHVILLSLIVYLEKKPEEEVKYIQAELWSSLPPESTTKNENSFRNQEKNTAKSPTKKIDNFKKTPQRNTKLKNDEIGIDKEKAKKEKIAKEKAKAKLIAEQRAAEMERLKRSLPGIDSKAKNKTLGLDNSTRAGVTGGSSDGDRVGELADYSEKISSKIRRKIVFDLSKTKQNPKVVYKVIRKNNKYNEIQLINSSGNSEWDIAVRDAILRSIPLPDPDITEIPIPPPELELVFRPRDF